MRRAMISKALWHAVLSMWLHFPACVGGILLRPNGFLMIVLIPDIQSWQHMRAVECHLYDRSKITGFQRLPSAHFPKIQDAPWTWCRAAVSELKSLSHNIAQSYQISVKVQGFFNYDERRDSNISLWQASDECRCPIWSYTIGSSVFLFSSNAFSCHASCICFWRRAASAASFHEFNRS